ncbi:trypsin-like serine peptidase [Spirosoma soli]|uniref:Serine protease n=1 Tax=Spirosoma soli TaxID=1770529 RepID=A0ABW5M6T7_9BACT
MRSCFAFIVALTVLLTQPGQSQDCRPDPATRTRVVDATLAPYRYLCAIKVYRKRGSHPATAFLISPTVLVTAGHSISKRGSKIRRIDVMPFINGRPSDSSKIVFDRSEVSLFVDANYKGKRGQSEFDYGTIKLSTDTLFRIIGGHFIWKDNYQYLKDGESLPVHLAGYPCDQVEYEMYEQDGRIDRLQSQCITYNFYTRKRNSGSPVWVDVNGQAVVVGIHNTGYGKKCRPVRPPRHCSKGARINQKVYNNITSWMN